MTGPPVKDLFANDIHRRIEEVIKVDQTDAQVLREEITEYVVTDAIRRSYATVLERYYETPNKPHEGVGIWVSGFFGSGKSSFAKILGLALEDYPVQGTTAAELFGQRTGDARIQVLLKNIRERIPTEAVIFDIATDRSVRTGNQNVTEILYRVFLQHLGYARDLDLAELEITLEGDGRLDRFRELYRSIYEKEWDGDKSLVAVALQRASRVMHDLEPQTFATADSWRQSAQNRADINPGQFAERCQLLMQRRRPGRAAVFVIDEVGQFVARDVQKMLDLQALVQSLGRVGRGKMWLVITSQEKLGELVGGLDDKRVELARLMDRFPLQVHLEPSDISEVTSKRVLSKNASAQKTLRELYNQHKGRLTDNTRLTADITLPDLGAESFIDLYPLLPYQVDLIIQIVSGLRTQGGAIKHVGGANRTIIKLAQQLLIHPDVRLAEQPVGVLARIDQMYDLLSGNISSEIRGKIDAIPQQVNHPLASTVAKAICLLQYVQSVHRTAENIAAALHPGVDADSRLPEVREALKELVTAHQVREANGQYRIPTPAEDDWEQQRASVSPKQGDVNRIHAETLEDLWQPQPSHSLCNTKQFKAGLNFNGRNLVEGDITVHLALAEAGADHDSRVAEMRARSQTERSAIFWVAALDPAIETETREIFRSKEILSRKERGAQTKDETALVSEEKIRLRRHQEELRRLLKERLLSGAVFFRGNDRSPQDGTSDVSQAASKVLGQALPQVFERFSEAAARVQGKDLDALLTSENLLSLTPVFTDLDLIREKDGKPIFKTESGPLAEVLARIESRNNYGESATGRYLVDHFAAEPYGWDFDVVRLFTVSQIRAGRVEAVSKGQTIDSATSLPARNTFPNNNLFRQASFRLKEALDFAQVVDAADAFQKAFGKEISELEQGVVARTIREEVTRHAEDLQAVHTLLVRHDLPGAEVLQEALDQVRAIRSGTEENVIQGFNTAWSGLKEAIKRAADLKQALHETNLHTMGRAREAQRRLWQFLQGEPDLDESCREHAVRLRDLLQQETFFRELPAIDQHTRALEESYRERFDAAVKRRAEVYQDALERLHATSGWDQLAPEQQEEVESPLAARATTNVDAKTSIPLLREAISACPSLLNAAVEKMLGILEGSRLVTVRVAGFFNGGIESTEELDTALAGLRDECERLIGEGKKILLQ
jgi:hypothetical protein